MSITGGLALYFIIWWLTLFAVLPIGVRSQHEDGPTSDGTEPGAPLLPRMGFKLLLTSVLAIPIFALAWYFIVVADW